MVLGAYSEWSANNGDLDSGCERVPMLAAVGILVLQLVSSQYIPAHDLHLYCHLLTVFPDCSSVPQLLQCYVDADSQGLE